MTNQSLSSISKGNIFLTKILATASLRNRHNVECTRSCACVQKVLLKLMLISIQCIESRANASIICMYMYIATNPPIRCNTTCNIQCKWNTNTCTYTQCNCLHIHVMVCLRSVNKAYVKDNWSPYNAAAWTKSLITLYLIW